MSMVLSILSKEILCKASYKYGCLDMCILAHKTMDFPSQRLIMSIFPILILLTACITTSYPTQQTLINCLTQHPNIPLSTIYTPNNPSYPSILNSTAQNPKFLEPSVPKPDLIFTPLTESHVQACVVCCNRLNIHMRP